MIVTEKFHNTVLLSDGTLQCNSTSMTMNFNLTKLNLHNREFQIFFLNHQNTSACIVQHNSTEHILNNDTITLRAKFNECGIAVYQRDNEIVYNQTVVILYGENPQSSLVFREEETVYGVECTKTNNLTIQLDQNYFNVSSMRKQIFHKGWFIFFLFQN